MAKRKKKIDTSDNIYTHDENEQIKELQQAFLDEQLQVYKLGSELTDAKSRVKVASVISFIVGAVLTYFITSLI